jgi:hypothetical protein
MARRIARTVLGMVISIVVLALASPMLLYAVGLHGVAGRPAVPQRLAPTEERLAVWRKARGTGEPALEPVNPYIYISRLAGTPRIQDPGLLVAWWVASEYNLEHQRYKGGLWWHLSGAALMIWLTRHWSIDQLLSKVAESKGGR